MNTLSMPTILLLVSLSWEAVPVHAVAGPLPDPTRPPAIAGFTGNEGQQDGQVAPAESRGLEFVLISPGRRTAIINGHEVELGAKYGDATLIEINEGSVVLRSAQGRKSVLTMFPGVGVVKREVAAQPHAEEKVKTDATEEPAADDATPQAGSQEEK
jgi:MSHA biogenesis protein MshK